MLTVDCHPAVGQDHDELGVSRWGRSTVSRVFCGAEGPHGVGYSAVGQDQGD